MIYLVCFIFGMLFTYIFQSLDLISNHFSNKQSLSVSKMNAEIERLNDGEGKEEFQPSIGFQYQPEMEYDDERDD